MRIFYTQKLENILEKMELARLETNSGNLLHMGNRLGQITGNLEQIETLSPIWRKDV